MTDISLVCSLARDAATACAAARAGVSRIQELDLLNPMLFSEFGKETPDGLPPIKGHPCFGLGKGFSGAGKAVELGKEGLVSLLKTHKSTIDNAKNPALLLGLSDLFVEDMYYYDQATDQLPNDWAPSDVWQQKAHGIAYQLTQQTGLSIELSSIYTLYGGHAVLGTMLNRAQALMQEQGHDQKQGHDLIILGCIDSLLEPKLLVASAGLGLMATDDNPVGYMPGEASAFSLTRLDANNSLQVSHVFSIAGLQSVDKGTNLEDDTVPLGKEMSALVRSALQQAGIQNSADIQQVIVDHNGLEWHAYEWGNTLMRLQEHGISFDTATTIFPVVSFGEIGTTTGLASLAMAEQGYRRGYFKGATLVVLTSFNGQRTALVLTGNQ